MSFFKTSVLSIFPNFRFGFDPSAGTTLATGFPLLVIRIDSCVLFNSSIMAMHFSLNLEIGIDFMFSLYNDMCPGQPGMDAGEKLRSSTFCKIN